MKNSIRENVSKSIVLNSRETRCLIAFCIMILFFLPYAFLEPISSDTNDDTAMNLIAAGAFGENSQFLVYTNVLYGFFLKGLYTIVPGVNWYLWIAILCNAVSAALLGSVLAYFLDYRILFPALTLFHFYVAGEFYRSVQFTRNGYLYAICGVVLLLMGGIVEKHRRKVSVIGGGALLLAFMVRKECLVPVIPFLAVMLFRQFMKKKQKCILMLTVLLCTVGLCGGAALADQMLFRERPEWQEYFDYHFNGTYPLLDDDINHWFSFDPEHMDFEMNDLLLLMEYQYADLDYYSVDYLERMRGKRVSSDFREGLNTIGQIVMELHRFPEIPDYVQIGGGLHGILYALERFAGWNVFLELILVAASIALAAKRKIPPKEYLWIVLLAGCMFFDLLAVVYAAGHTPRRATIGFRMAFELLAVFVLVSGKKPAEPEIEEAQKQTFRYPAFLTGIVLLCVVMLRVMNFTAIPNNTETRMVLDELRQFDSECYVLDGMLLWGERLGITDLRKLNRTNYENYFAHFALSGGWLAETPHATHFMKERGISAPMMQMGLDSHFHYVVRLWKAEQLVPLMNDYLGRRCGRGLTPQPVYAGTEVCIVDFLQSSPR